MIAGVAHDLHVVQEFCHTKFAIPDELTPLERINLRVARSLIEGHMVASPEARTVTIVLSGHNSPALREMLTSGGQLSFPATELRFTIGAKELVLENVLVFHPRATPLNGDAAIEALDRGHGEGFRFRLRPGDDPYFYLAMPQQMPNPKAPMTEWTLAEWSLPGITQPGVEDTSAA